MVALALVLPSVSACQRQKAAPVVRSTESAAAKCVASGGAMIQGPLRRGPAVCVHLFADRGKLCRDSKECDGECRYADRSLIADPRTNGSALWNEETAYRLPSSDQIGKDGVGHCQWSDDDESGCKGTVEGGKIRNWECVD